MALKDLQDRVIEKMDLPRPLTNPDREGQLTEADIRNVKSEWVLMKLLELLEQGLDSDTCLDN